MIFVYGRRFHSDRNLVSASQDGKLIVWDGYTTNKVTFTCQTMNILKLCWSVVDCLLWKTCLSVNEQFLRIRFIILSNVFLFISCKHACQILNWNVIYALKPVLPDSNIKQSYFGLKKSLQQRNNWIVL